MNAEAVNEESAATRPATRQVRVVEDQAPVAPDLHAIALRYLVYALAVAFVFTLASGLADTTPFYWVRLISYLTLFAVAIYLRARELTVTPILVGFYALWWVMPILDLASTTDHGYGSRTTMALALAVVSVVMTGLHRNQRWLIPLLSILNGLWIIITALQADVTTAVIGDELIAMVVGYWLLARLVLRLTREADDGYRTARRAARLEEALAAASERLLGGTGDAAIQNTLELLAREIDGNALIVEEGSGDGDGAYRVVAGVGDLNCERLRDGTSGDLPAALREALHRGPVTVDVASLEPSEAEMYGPIRHELALPIVVQNGLRGRLAAFSSNPEAPWANDEVRMLARVADTIANFWEREAASQRLRDLMRSKDEFIASVSHELRTPLTVVLGLAQELAESAGSDLAASEIDELHRLVAEQSNEMAQIVEDLLVAARADLGTLTIRPSQVHARQAIEEVVAQIGPSFLTGRSFKLEGPEMPVHADPLRFRQIVRNLLTNAAHYGGGTIRVQLSEEEEKVRIAVSDNGRGIPTELAESIFEPYTSAHKREGQPGSIGLGLTVARDLARLMGGDLTLATEPGWTTFVALIPRYRG